MLLGLRGVRVSTQASHGTARAALLLIAGVQTHAEKSAAVSLLRESALVYLLNSLVVEAAVDVFIMRG